MTNAPQFDAWMVLLPNGKPSLGSVGATREKAIEFFLRNGRMHPGWPYEPWEYFEQKGCEVRQVVITVIQERST